MPTGWYVQPVPGSVVEIIADDGLCRLGDGIVYHKNDRKEVTYNAECGYTAFSQMADKYIIPQEHHAGNGCLADKGGRSQPDHVADVTAGKPHAFSGSA